MVTPLTSARLAAGRILREPPGATPGYWAGCPGVCFDPQEQAWYLTYRLRRRRGVAPDRGGEVRIARSTDLARWDDVLAITKDRYASASIERSCLHRGPDGHWHYFTSYVHPDDGRWCTAVLRARPELKAALALGEQVRVSVGSGRTLVVTTAKASADEAAVKAFLAR